jgi:hypothetical protein
MKVGCPGAGREYNPDEWQKGEQAKVRWVGLPSYVHSQEFF